MRQFAIILGLLLSLTVFGTIRLRLLTGYSWLESAYLAIVTLTTVGSRDVPHETGPMVFVMIYLIGGIGLFSYSAFQLGQMIVRADFARVLETRRMSRNLDQLQNHFIVCGLGRMGLVICESLASRNQPFVAIDHSEAVIESVCKPRKWLYVVGDATDDAVLEQAGISRAKGLSTALATDADNVYVVLSARLLSSSLLIISRASDDSAVQKLKRAGASRVVSPFSSGAEKMTRIMLNPHLEDFLEITDESGHSLEIVELEIAADSPYAGQELAATDLSQRGIMVIGVRRKNGDHLMVPRANSRIQVGDKLFAFGNALAIGSMEQETVSE